MPKKTPKHVLARARLAEARLILATQDALVRRLRSLGEPTLEAEEALQSYTSALRHLEAHELKLREEADAKKGETKKKR
jgi:hypothetical protein